MTSKRYAVINEIEHETEKAILVSAGMKTWLPKSQIKVHEIEGITVIELPTWLWAKNSGSLRILTSPEEMYN